jgi:hypothetical protein
VQPVNFDIFHYIIGITQAFFLICGAWWGYAFYSGKVKFSGEAEEKRKERVKKYGVILILAVIICLVGGVMLMLINLFKLIETLVS